MAKSAETNLGAADRNIRATGSLYAESDARTAGTAEVDALGGLFVLRQRDEFLQRLFQGSNERKTRVMCLSARSSISPAKASIEEARANLVEALSLFFETADPSEMARRFRSEVG